ncbi:Uncharacterised protein [Salmonella enterica subsp. arizonae]|uniref:Uncharacterized protein n=1 Tax=Salmonella enterica subsp. arizonae TaxID=59203 RepID=A0A379S4D9_SALER|nr:Uncharacterised protein [Salmonella enterica subsp. arizonae]
MRPVIAPGARYGITAAYKDMLSIQLLMLPL